ncbi:MAG: hypothetical protein AVDCRST_MAG56-2582 [uncultured Cytophagales bacterium]|uniref:Uncharacterized protein n=1 Tax=uncultured Cytophagales bacterium TaxID=158755 RepID=A0A6J4IXT8_9SPHI|nr:MAG: hypothetical protein AVDCRST_MAG56-2582 [uncultured Cytophagales bacterium]
MAGMRDGLVTMEEKWKNGGRRGTYGRQVKCGNKRSIQ